MAENIIDNDFETEDLNNFKHTTNWLLEIGISVIRPDGRYKSMSDIFIELVSKYESGEISLDDVCKNMI